MGIFAILLLLAIVLVVVIIIQRTIGDKEDQEGASGADIVAYLVLALSMAVAGFALADLASVAFPGDSFVFDPAEEIATSLSALVVSTPFLLYFWRRQARRRAVYPRSAGWTLYLSIVEMVFMTAFVITAVLFLNGFIGEESVAAWTGALIFGVIVAFHEYSARIDPPLSDAGELRRVVGSAIGLITATIGIAGVLTTLLAMFFESFGVNRVDAGFEPWLAMSIVGTPIWVYRWLRPWDTEPAAPRLVWTVAVSVVALATALGAGTAVVVTVLQYLFGDSPPAAAHFDVVPVALALSVSGFVVWIFHRRELGRERSDPLQAYEYLMAAIGLAVAVAMAIALTIATFDRSLIVGGGTRDVLAFATILTAGLAAWLFFGVRRQAEVVGSGIFSWPRRVYTLGLGVIFGLIATGALITTIFILLRRALGDAGSGSLLEPMSVFVYTGLVGLYLLRSYAAERAVTPSADVIVPFQVTIVCSHPGMIATGFPEQARLRVLHRGDDVGIIDEEMADDIVAAVANRPSLVWVDGDGFRVAPMRETT